MRKGSTAINKLAVGNAYASKAYLGVDQVWAAAGTPPPISDPNIVAYYKFDNNVIDSVGSLNGVLGTHSSYAFSGDNTLRYITLPNDATLRPSAKISVECWIYPTNVFSTLQSIITQDYVFNTKKGFAIFISAGTLIWRIGNGTLDYTVSTPVSNNTWYHVVGTYDGTTQRLYVNGTEVGTPQSVSGISYNAQATKIGSWNYSGTNYNFSGLIDEFRQYSIALSATQVTASYNSGAGTFGEHENGLIVGYHFDEGSGSTIYDYSNNKFNGTGTSVQWASSIKAMSVQPQYVTGFFGYTNDKALDFDGGGKVTVTHNAALDPNSITVYAWVRTIQNTAFAGLIDKGWNNGGYVMDINNGAPRFGVQRSTGTFYTAVSPNTIDDGQWHMIVGVYDAALSEVRIYVDGVLKNQVGSAIKSATTLDLVIGGDKSSTFTFAGEIDNVVIYNDVRSAAEILQDYNNGL